MTKKASKKRNELRVVNPPVNLYEQVKSLATKNKRTIGAQVEYMLEAQLNINNQ